MNVIHYMNMVHSDPTPLGRRERKRQARIDGILSTAMELVIQDGLEACTIHRLAKELDLAVGALYRYFPSKGAIIAALELRVINDYKIELDEALESAESIAHGLPPSAQALFPVVQAAWEYERLARVEPGRFRLINLILATPEHVMPEDDGQRVVGAMLTAFGIMNTRFERAVVANALGPGNAAERTVLYWAAIRGVLQVAKLERFEPALLAAERLCESTVRTMLLGWGAQKEIISEVFALRESWAAMER